MVFVRPDETHWQVRDSQLKTHKASFSNTTSLIRTLDTFFLRFEQGAEGVHNVQLCGLRPLYRSFDNGRQKPRQRRLASAYILVLSSNLGSHS